MKQYSVFHNKLHTAAMSSKNNLRDRMLGSYSYMLQLKLRFHYLRINECKLVESHLDTRKTMAVKIVETFRSQMERLDNITDSFIELLWISS